MVANGTDDARLLPWERGALVLFFVVLVGFGVLVENRSAFLSRRMGDLGVYLRAGWAVRHGADLYAITDDNGWHYNYPPLFAILLSPLADPPPGQDKAGMVPYPVSVAICYALNLVLLGLAVHWLASALEQTSDREAVRSVAVGSRRWWRLRIFPVLVCLPPIGHTLMRGQANLLLLALICATLAATLRGRRFLAGVSLAGAICIKLFPAYLLLYPLWRRDGRCLAGCCAGLVVGLGLVPLAVLGPARTVQSYRSLAEGLVGPGLGLSQHPDRAKELLEVTATDSQSFLAVIHNTLHPDRDTRPNEASPLVRKAHWALAGLATLATLAAARRVRRDSGPAGVLLVGALTLIMLLTSPVCHTHYFALALPLVMGLLSLAWQEQGDSLRLPPKWLLLAGAHLVGNILPLLPFCEVLKDQGAAMYAALLIWLAACLVLRRLVASAPSLPLAGELARRAVAVSKRAG